MSGDLETKIRNQPLFSNFVDYGSTSSFSLDKISFIAKKCEELFYKNFKGYEFDFVGA